MQGNTYFIYEESSSSAVTFQPLASTLLHFIANNLIIWKYRKVLYFEKMHYLCPISGMVFGMWSVVRQLAGQRYLNAKTDALMN